MTATFAIWSICIAATALLMLSPGRLPGAVWPVAGALVLVGCRLLPLADAVRGVHRAADVMLFLAGMMVLAELGRAHGLFDWLAGHALGVSRGSAERLFALVYGVGIVVTVFLSNDATAVVLTPAVAAVTRAARIERPLPFLLSCAFIANAASFVLPISNPANLVIYASQMPPLVHWLERFALPSFASIAATFLLLRWTQRKSLAEPMPAPVERPGLEAGGRWSGLCIIATAILLTLVSWAGKALGWPTFAAAVASVVLVSGMVRKSPLALVRGISWSVLPLVAGLFVLVEGLARTGLVATLTELVQAQAGRSVGAAAWASGLAIAVVSNVVNNLPAGLIAGTAIQGAGVAEHIGAATLIGVDLGPNLSVTGSLATILWLDAVRRERLSVSALDFLKIGLVVMPPALLLTLFAVLASP